jgi:hypothetical protein
MIAPTLPTQEAGVTRTGATLRLAADFSALVPSSPHDAPRQLYGGSGGSRPTADEASPGLVDLRASDWRRA